MSPLCVVGEGGWRWSTLGSPERWPTTTCIGSTQAGAPPWPVDIMIIMDWPPHGLHNHYRLQISGAILMDCQIDHRHRNPWVQPRSVGCWKLLATSSHGMNSIPMSCHPNKTAWDSQFLSHRPQPVGLYNPMLNKEFVIFSSLIWCRSDFLSIFDRSESAWMGEIRW